MKQITTLITVYFFCFISYFSIAQELGGTYNNDLNNCNGTILMQNYDYLYSGNYTWGWYNNNFLVSSNDTIVTGLCAGGYVLKIDSMSIQVDTAFILLYNACSTLSISCATSNSALNSCTGTSYTTITGGNPFGNVGAQYYNYTWSNGATTLNQTNLCAGNYILSVSDGNVCILSDTIQISYPGFDYDLNTSDDSTNSCNGSALLNITGGIAPFTVTWSTGDTITSIDSLCAGIYSVTATDATNATIAGAFIIVDSSTLYGTNPYQDSTVLGTLNGPLYANCSYFITQVDSASLANVVYDSLSLTLNVTYQVYSSNGVELIYDTLTDVSLETGVWNVTISVYCPNKSGSDFFKVKGYFYYNSDGNYLSISENDFEEYSVYPNPFNSIITINSKNEFISEYSLFDVNGKLLQSKNALNTNQLELNDLEKLENGSYFLQITSLDGQIKVIKLIK